MLNNFEFKNGWDYYPFKIASHYLSALINSDVSGLSDEEHKEFSKWERGVITLVENSEMFHWDCDNNSYFGKDDVTELMAEVVDVRLVFKNAS